MKAVISVGLLLCLSTPSPMDLLMCLCSGSMDWLSSLQDCSHICCSNRPRSRSAGMHVHTCTHTHPHNTPNANRTVIYWQGRGSAEGSLTSCKPITQTDLRDVTVEINGNSDLLTFLKIPICGCDLSKVVHIYIDHHMHEFKCGINSMFVFFFFTFRNDSKKWWQFKKCREVWN